MQADETAGNDADAVNLRHNVHEGGQDGGHDGDQANRVAAIAGAEKVGNGVLTEAAQIRREEQSDQDETAGPANNIGQPLKAGEVKGSGQADEGGGTHPVGAGRHAVEEGRHAPPGDVVLGDIGGPADDADQRVHRNGETQEGVADPARRHAVLFENRQRPDE